LVLRRRQTGIRTWAAHKGGSVKRAEGAGPSLRRGFTKGRTSSFVAWSLSGWGESRYARSYARGVLGCRTCPTPSLVFLPSHDTS